MCGAVIELIELFTLACVGPGPGPGGGDCAPPGPLSLFFTRPFAVGIDEPILVPPEVCVSRVAGGRALCDWFFFLPKRNDIVAPASRWEYLLDHVNVSKQSAILQKTSHNWECQEHSQNVTNNV